MKTVEDAAELNVSQHVSAAEVSDTQAVKEEGESFAVEKRGYAVAMGAIAQFRIMGGCIGLAIVTAIQHSYLCSHLEFLGGDVVEAILQSTSGIATLPTNTQHLVRETYGASYELQMKVLAGMAGAQVLTSLTMWQKKSLCSSLVCVNFYDSDKLGCDRAYFNPAHMDGGTLTILARATGAYDGLEIADLTTTEKLDSEGIGLDASFISVPAIPGEVIVLAGTRLQRIFGKDKVRACVHRVCNPAHMSNSSAVKERLSLAIFCAPPSNFN
ncbi:hypothetical protein N7478_006321 [Penicillium angulare]|uniref:uncharacterized protein n=1 Tax=Penicillium angulare TaxID=116970 RepID=UPI0025422D34|nr:uncharacterized protein N7478_006321 [Penicillium angulare]KAJ5280949.1 hypothetical protein N7478_006321 [Penicillium angulare]